MTDTFLGIVVAVLIAFAGGIFIGAIIEADGHQKQAISRGYAMYCPVDGNFAWVGECE